MDRINQWINSAPGRRIDVDGAYGLQCKDVIDDYCLYLFNDWLNTIRPANAKEAFANSNPEFFEKIANNPNDPNLVPQRGDIVIWGAMSGNPYGHIAVVVDADPSGVTVVEQDGFLQVPARVYRRPYVIAGGIVIGWLRPRLEKIIGYVAPQPLSPTDRRTAITVNAREEANTSSGIFQEVDAGAVVAMKGYITNGEPVEGNTTWFVTANSGKYMTAEAFEDKGTHDLPDLTPRTQASPTERVIGVQGVRARKSPNTSSETVQVINGGKTVEMSGWTHGESVENNDVWFVSKLNRLFLWSGAFTDTSSHDLPEVKQETTDSLPTPIDYSKIILDVSNNQSDEVASHFHKFGGVVLKAGHVGQKSGGDANKIDPKMARFAKVAGDKLLGIYWLPYFSTVEEARTEAERFAEAQRQVDAPLLFVDLEPDFEGTDEQLKLFSNVVLQKTGKQVFTYAGNAVIQKLGLARIDWYPNYGTKDNYAHGALIHQFTDTGKIDGYGGNLDFSTAKVSIDELKDLGKIVTPLPPKGPETPKPSDPDTKPSEPEKPKTPEVKPNQSQELERNKPGSFWQELIRLLAKLVKIIFKKR